MNDIMIQLNDNFFRLNNHGSTFYNICTMLFLLCAWKLIIGVLFNHSHFPRLCRVQLPFQEIFNRCEEILSTADIWEAPEEPVGIFGGFWARDH